MKMNFERAYLCVGCGRKYKKSKVRFCYKSVCICTECYGKFEPYSSDAYFEALGNVTFLKPAFRYSGVYRDIFLNYKFNAQIAYGHILGMAIGEQIGKCKEICGYSYIVPIPVSKKRFNERGYNQSLIPAEYISEALNIPILDVVVRTKHSVPQSTVDNSIRSVNVRNAFETDFQFRGENVIIFDDIYTTGSTVYECAKILKKAGAGSICAVSGAYNFRVRSNCAPLAFI